MSDPRETVAAIYAGWNAGEWGLEHFHPDVDWELLGAGRLDQAGPARGRASLLDYWRRFWAAWRPGASWEIEELETMGDDRCLACGRLRAVGHSSGLESEIAFFHLWTVSDELVVRLLVCDDRETAMRAAEIGNHREGP